MVFRESAGSRLFARHEAHAHEIGARLGMHLFHEMAAMDFDRTVARAERAGDLLARLALDDEFEHFALPRRQRAQPFAHELEFFRTLTQPIVFVERLADPPDQMLVLERFL